MILLWVLIGALAASSLWQIAYQCGWSKGWRGGCEVYQDEPKAPGGTS